jgi:hypothetical protein
MPARLLLQTGAFLMEFLKIVVISTVAGILYGIVHDQVTARVCLEYFTVLHPLVFHTQSPTLLAMGWGIFATWEVGAFLGVCVAIACRVGSPPRLAAGDMIAPIAWLLMAMAVCALVSGIIGFFWGPVPEDMRGLLAPDLERRFLADWWAHSASYAAGFFGGMVLCAVAVRRRLEASAVTES